MDTMTNTTPISQPQPGTPVLNGPSYTVGVEDLPWQGEDAFYLSDEDGQPTLFRTCTSQLGWSFSTVEHYDADWNRLPGFKVSSFRLPAYDGDPSHEASRWACKQNHPTLHGAIFPTRNAASQAAYEAGVLRYFFYRKAR